MFDLNDIGNPQKAPPCGDDGTAVMTNIVTPYQAGDTVTITIDETVFHPGHYRIALAVDDISELPDPPPVTPADTPCGSAPIQQPPVFPVLADGVFEHTEPFTEPQSIDVTIPDDVSCTNCTLQVIQFMSNHGLNNPGGCYYHHCAALAVDEEPAGTTSPTTGDPGSTSDDPMTSATSASTADGTGGGATTGDGADDGSGSGNTSPGTGGVTGIDTDPGQDSDGGCGCSLPQDDPEGPLGALLGLFGLMTLRRRRSARPDA